MYSITIKGGYTMKQKSSIKHMLHMMLCCGLPMIIIFSLPYIARFSPSLSGILAVIAPFICPIMMGSMVFMMFRKRGSGCCNEKESPKKEI